MAPPGRRRHSLSMYSVLLVTVLFFAHSVSAVSAVLGIDLGTEYIKAVLVKPGTPLEIVLSKDSKRKEPSILGFKTPKPNLVAPGNFPERSYGSAAQALTARFPWDSYPNLKQLLGLPSDGSTVVDSYKARFPAVEIIAQEPRKTVAFQSRSFGKGEEAFAVEELLAMVLKNVKANAQEMAGKTLSVKNVVFTVPPFYTIEEKSALELAASLADFKVLGVISDGLAVGLHYATSRKFESINDGAKPEHHLIFDVGAGYTTATVLKLQGRTVKDVGKYNKNISEVIVQGTGWDRTLGGDALNQIIVEDIATKFIESTAGKKLGKTAKDVLANGRASARLWKDAEKIRQVLSANQQSSGSWEELYEDVDFKYKLTRPDFEAKTTHFAARLAAPFNSALKAANLTVAELDSIILHGGATRTPFIQKSIESLAGDKSKIRTNVNSDEAAVFGAAFRAATISPSFRVKEIRTYEAANYPTWIQYRKEKDGKTTQQKIFTPSSYIGATKVVTLPLQEDFELYMFQKRPTDAGSPFESAKQDNTGTRYTAQNLTGSVAKLVKDFGCKADAISTKVTLRLDPVWGLPEVVGGSVSCDHEVPDKAGIVDNVKDFLGFGKKDANQKVLKDDKKGSSSSSASSKSSSSSASSSSSEAASKDSKDPKAKEEDKAPKMKTETETIKFEFEANHDVSASVGYVEHKFKAERIRSFDASDKNRIAREEDLNNLESFVYKARDLLEDATFTQFASKPMIQDIEKYIKSTSTWLSEEGATAVSETLKEKLKGLKKLVDPIRSRKEESLSRPESTKLLREAMEQAKSLLKVIEDSIAMAASSSSSSSSSTSTSTATDSSASSPSSSSSADPLADLEHEETSTSSSAASETPSPAPYVSPYTEAELKEMKAAYEDVEQWMEKKLAEQEKLQLWEDPVFKAGELTKKGKDLNDKLMKIFTEKLQQQRAAEDKIKAQARKAKREAEKKAKAAKAKAEEQLKDIKNKAEQKASSAGEKIKEAASSATDKAAEATESVKEKAEKIKDEL